MSTIKEYVLEHFNADERKDICAHGMVSGFGNLVYYADTCAFHDKYEDEIWNMLNDDLCCLEHGSVLEMIGDFKGGKDVGSLMQLKNLLCWYAVERVCFELVNNSEENEANV